MVWLADKFRLIASWMERKSVSNDVPSKFSDLAPIDNADEDGVYSDAIRFALSKDKVSNIALTGPYGSGKSSIIQSFLKSYGKPVLQISLASFVSGTGKLEGVTRQEIERSILQQMLYGADSNKLPFSRFKRIQSPGAWSALKSFSILVGMLSVWYVFNNQDDVASGDFFNPISLSNWKNYLSIIIAIPFLWKVLHYFYVSSFGLSLKSISLKDVEIKPDRDDQESILNRHLDEIIYFFQSTSYELVVIEDLDRFDDAEIFVTLREINKLVNDNSGVRHPVRFLYALRDDMFANTERTKFFEFIIPVIPIINTSNSIDMVLVQGRRLNLEEKLDNQFLREVSQYLNDLRLIQNIFNEYSIYIEELEKDQKGVLDPNKLLSVLIYKNVYPKDFEQLHRGEGKLAEILNLQSKLIKDAEVGYRKDIVDLENRIEVAEQQVPRGVQELRKIYAMALIEHLPEYADSVRTGSSQWVALRDLTKEGILEEYLDAPNVHCIYQRGHHQISVNIKNWQDSVCLNKNYYQREVEVANKSVDSKVKISNQILEIRSKISRLRVSKLSDLLRLNPESTRELFDGFGNDGKLARFLVLEGYLDDTYYQYTSLFHEGRLSPNDNKFLIQIRAYIQPEPDLAIDNPKEVIAAMRSEDFSQAYVLNVKIVDTLLSNQGDYHEHRERFFGFISSGFDDCEEFLEVYYDNGGYVSLLFSGLVDNWEGFIPAIVSTKNKFSHVSQLISMLPKASLIELGSSYEILPEFVSLNFFEILSRIPEVEAERFVCLGFEVKDFSEIREYPQVVRSMFSNGLFEITIPNLEYIYQEVLHAGEVSPMRERNLTTIRSTENESLIGRIERDFDVYFSRVLLELDENSKEDVPAILSVLGCDDLNDDDIKGFVESQDILLPDLERVPEHSYVMMFETVSVEASWSNCLTFMNSETFDRETLLDYLNRDIVREVILRAPIPDDDESKKLRTLLFEANVLSDVGYREYVSSLPQTFDYIPYRLEESKLRILIEEERINFTRTVFDELNSYRTLQLLFVEYNISNYLQDSANFDLSDEFLEGLLRTGIRNEDKLSIVRLMDLNSLISLPERARIVGSVLSAEDNTISGIDADIAHSLIDNSSPVSVQVLLLNKYHTTMENDEVRRLLESLPRPYCEIQKGYVSPRLDDTPQNIELVRWLDSRDIISSWSYQTSYFSGDCIKVNLYRK